MFCFSRETTQAFAVGLCFPCCRIRGLQPNLKWFNYRIIDISYIAYHLLSIQLPYADVIVIPRDFHRNYGYTIKFCDSRRTVTSAAFATELFGK